MKFLIKHDESDSAWIEEFENYDAAYAANRGGLVDIYEIPKDHMIFKHHATGELKEVKLLVKASKNETIVEDIKTGKMWVMHKSYHTGFYNLKRSSFNRMEIEEFK